MDTFAAIEQRRSVKHYDADHRMGQEEIERLFSLAMLSPTSFNMQHTRFVVVQDAALRREIRAASWDQAQVTDASLLIVLCADVQAWGKDPARYWRHAPDKVRGAIVPMIDGFYRDKPVLQRDECMRSTGIAAQTLMLAAKAMGYDSCPMVGFDVEAVARLIRLPDDHVISMFVVVGKGMKPAGARSGLLAFREMVITDRFE